MILTKKYDTLIVRVTAALPPMGVGRWCADSQGWWVGMPQIVAKSSRDSHPK